MSNDLTKWKVFKKKYLTWGKPLTMQYCIPKGKVIHDTKVLED